MKYLLLTLTICTSIIFGQRIDTTFHDNGSIQGIWKKNYSDSLEVKWQGLVLNEWSVEEFNKEGSLIYSYLEDTFTRRVISQKAYDLSGNILRYEQALNQKNNSGYERFYSPKGKLVWENKLTNFGYEGKVKMNYNYDLFDMKYSYPLENIDLQSFFKSERKADEPYWIVNYIHGKKNGSYNSKRGSKGEYENDVKEGVWKDISWLNSSFYQGTVFHFGEYQKGLKTGVWIELSSKKDTLSYQTFKNDTLYGEKRVYKEGVFQQSIYYKNGRENQPANFTVNSDYRKGKMVDGKKEGLWRFFYSDGTVLLNFKDGIPVSPYIWKFKEDTLEICSFSSGSTYKYDNKWSRYKDTRALKREGITYYIKNNEKDFDTLVFKNNKVVESFIYYKKIERIQLELTKPMVYQYSKYGFTINNLTGRASIANSFQQTIEVGSLKKGIKEGFWEKYYKNELINKGNYISGKKSGSWSIYEANQISDSIIYDNNENELEHWRFENGEIFWGKRNEYNLQSKNIKSELFEPSLNAFHPYLEKSYNDEGVIIILKIWNKESQSYTELFCDTSKFSQASSTIKDQANIVLPLREYSYFYGVSFSENGKYAYIYYNEGSNGITYLVDVDQHKIIKEFSHIVKFDGYVSYKLSNTGRYLIVKSENGETYLKDLLLPAKKTKLEFVDEEERDSENIFSFSSKDSLIYASTLNSIEIYQTSNFLKVNSKEIVHTETRIERIRVFGDSVLMVLDEEKLRLFALPNIDLIHEYDLSGWEISSKYDREYILDSWDINKQNEFKLKFFNCLNGDSLTIEPKNATKSWSESSAYLLEYKIDSKRKKAFLWFSKNEKKYKKLSFGDQVALIVWDIEKDKVEFVSNHYSFGMETEGFSQVNSSGNLFYIGTRQLEKELSDEQKMAHISEYNTTTHLSKHSLYEKSLSLSPEIMSSKQLVLIFPNNNYGIDPSYEFDLGRGLLRFNKLSRDNINLEIDNEESRRYFNQYSSLEDQIFQVYYDVQSAPKEVQDIIKCQVLTDLGLTYADEDIEIIFFQERKVLIFNDVSKSIDHFNYNKASKIERKVSLFIDGNGEFIFTTPDRYYMASTNAEDFVHFEKNLQIYPFEQFDLKYNRPDIILDRLGYADSSLIQAYHKAYKKRLKKMDFTEDMLKDDFHMPEIQIENFESMPNITGENSIDLNLNMQDDLYNLDRINIWINDVAIYGSNGISLRDKNTQNYQQKINLNLTKGMNKIQVSVLNQAGAESYKETVEINCIVGKVKPNLYLVTIGESKFQQSEYNLKYASKDAQDVAKLFGESKVFDQVYSKILTDEEVTKESIQNLKGFLKDADINDEVMIFIAGHGVLGDELDYFFASYDMDFENPKKRGIAYSELESLLDGIAPLKKILFIDACHSGEIDKDEVELAVNDQQEKGDIQFRAVGKKVSPKLGMQNTSELSKSLFTDLRKGTGATVISSAGGMEFAMEGADWNNGLFTYCLLNGVRSNEADLNGDNEIWLSEMQEYIQSKVFELSGGKQKPTSRIENQVVDFRLF